MMIGGAASSSATLRRAPTPLLRAAKAGKRMQSHQQSTAISSGAEKQMFALFSPAGYRLLSTSGTLRQEQQFQEGQSRPPHQPQPKSKHRLVYREIWPPLLRVLSYGSGVFFGLLLLHGYLDVKEQQDFEAKVREDLEHELREQVKTRVSDQSDADSSTKGWWAWITRKA